MTERDARRETRDTGGPFGSGKAHESNRREGVCEEAIEKRTKRVVVCDSGDGDDDAFDDAQQVTERFFLRTCMYKVVLLQYISPRFSRRVFSFLLIVARGHKNMT